ncbi:hypothetical protein VNI00_000672 [Paramarasmius palmivorus]|uniref:NACHT domain-containing protein n=1 Tax=Paramarasmius palmivorus TaxID=297713 RepID=A0AAW0E8T1_9AGAR
MAFTRSRGIHIQGDARNEVHGDQININHTRTQNDEQAAVNATRDAEARYPAPNCHPDTRVSVLMELDKWICDREQTRRTRIYWIHGPAGVGKSAIAQKVSEDHDGQLVAVWFFSRNDSTRDKLDRFAATIAYQCCKSESLKDVRPFIIEAIRSDPNIFQTSFENQFRKLILEPFSKVHGDRTPSLIVIDGLDECLDFSSQGRLLRMVDDAIAFFTPNPFIFLLCNRPDPHILNCINRAAFATYLRRIPISYQTIRTLGYLSDSDLDIEKYLLAHFRRLRDEHPALWNEESWPGVDAVKSLVWRASGQFIFAATIIKYIDNLDELPQDRLQRILDTEPGDITDSPYADLDMLYRQVLSTCRKWDRVYPILRFLVSFDPRKIPRRLNGRSTHIIWTSSSMIARLFKLRTGELETLFSRLHSVIHIPGDGSDTQTLQTLHILHASFTEFLLDRARSREYHIPRFSKSEFNDLLADLFLRTLSSFVSLYPPYRSTARTFPNAYNIWQSRIEALSELQELSLMWPHCCMRVESPSSNLVAVLDGFDPYPNAAIVLSHCESKARRWDEPLSSVHWMNIVAWAKDLSTSLTYLDQRAVHEDVQNDTSLTTYSGVTTEEGLAQIKAIFVQKGTGHQQDWPRDTNTESTWRFSSTIGPSSHALISTVNDEAVSVACTIDPSLPDQESPQGPVDPDEPHEPRKTLIVRTENGRVGVDVQIMPDAEPHDRAMKVLLETRSKNGFMTIRVRYYYNYSIAMGLTHLSGSRPTPKTDLYKFSFHVHFVG